MEALFHQQAGEIVVDVQGAGEQGHDAVVLGLVLGTHVLDGHHVQLPTGQLGGQTHVLTVATDGLGQVGGFHGDVHGVVVFIDDDGGHIGRRHGVDHVLGRVVIVQHDVGALAAQLGRNRLNAGTAHADTGTDRVDATIVGLHRDLGAGTRVTGGPMISIISSPISGTSDAEQLFQEVRAGAADEQLGTTGFRTHGVQQAADAVAQAERSRAAACRRGRSRLRRCCRIRITLSRLLFLTTPLMMVPSLSLNWSTTWALGLAHFLHDDLLGGLGGDTVEGHGVDLIFHVVANLDIRLLDLGSFQG